MSNPQPNNPEHYGGFFNLTRDGIEHRVVDGSEILVCDADVPYPHDTHGVFSEVYLPRLENTGGRAEFTLLLPRDYLPLGSVLHEALGTVNKRGEQFSFGVFREIGHQILRMYHSEKKVPASLHLNDVIVNRDVYGLALLPPAGLNITPGPGTLIGLGTELRDDCLELALTDQEKTKMYKAFNGYLKALSEGLDV